MMSSDLQQNERQYEQTHVHEVYNNIASHFSSTRYKPWPIVKDFLKDLTPGAVGLDVGCGNGKYLTVNPDVFIVASDRSNELIRFASQHQPHSAIVADTLNLPHAPASFDFAISIAVIHHLSTPERRRKAIATILELLRPAANDTQVTNCSSRRKGPISAGQALFFVWALEQKGSRRGWDAGDDQDVLVPWVLKDDVKGNDNSGDDRSMETLRKDSPTTYQRYYHLYRKGELEEDIAAVGGKVVRTGYDRDNWWAIAERMPSSG